MTIIHRVQHVIYFTDIKTTYYFNTGWHKVMCMYDNEVLSRYAAIIYLQNILA